MDEQQNNKKVFNFGTAFLWLLLITSGAVIGLLYNDRSELQDQIVKRDRLAELQRKNDSIRMAQSKENESIVEKYISGCNILINGKEVSTEELLKYMRGQIETIDSLYQVVATLEDSVDHANRKVAAEHSVRTMLHGKLKDAYDSLGILQAFYNLAKKNLNTDFSVEGKMVKIYLPADSLAIYQRLYELAQRDYGIKYDLGTEDGYVTYTKLFSRADSALMIFEYYRDKLSKDTTDNFWKVEVHRRLWRKKNR